MTTRDAPEAVLAAALHTASDTGFVKVPLCRLPHDQTYPPHICELLAAAILAALDGWTLVPDSERLDVRRVVKAIENVAARHGIKKDPPAMPLALARIYGYSTTPDDMDAQIAAEYAALSQEASDD